MSLTKASYTAGLELTRDCELARTYVGLHRLPVVLGFDEFVQAVIVPEPEDSD